MMLKRIENLHGVLKLEKKEQRFLMGGAPPRCTSDASCEEGEECVIGQCIFIDC